jgi:ribosomal protein RSM22 (predicted rRNA methylase)
MDLPLDLRDALDAELGRISPQRLARATAALVARYRTGRPAPGVPLLDAADDIAAYAAYRLPATFAAIAAALAHLRERWAGEAPRSLLDVGAGPGTAMWAARAVWPALERVHLLERDERMIALGERLAARAHAPALRQARWQCADLLAPWDADGHDLVIAAYVLNELPEERRAAVIDALWSKAVGILVLLEPGTPADFARIRQARRQLLAAGATILAPCPHDRACPMPEDDWCHFAQRINRTRLHRHVKGGTLSYEDEKFSYVAASRQGGSPIAGRVLRHPQILPGRVVLQLCAPAGLRTSVVTRGKDRVAFRQARDLHWGSALPTDDGGQVQDDPGSLADPS